MGITYSTEQQQVIDARGCNVLVSAAAGSGKTAVLVERIIKLITQKETKVSLQQLLVVTFTKLAAQEMRERIGKGIERAIEEEQDPIIIRHLLKQLSLLPTAQITTLHSFCLSLLKNHYSQIQLDPKFKIGNETELVLMQEELLDDLLEAEYEQGNEAFLEVVECFSPGKNDEPLKELILMIYRFAMSHPWPLQWLSKSLDALSIDTMHEVYASIYFNVLLRDLREALERAGLYLAEIEDLMQLEGGPTKYKETFDGYKHFFDMFVEALENNAYDTLSSVIKHKSIPPLSRATKGFDKDLAKEAKDYFDELKKIVNDECNKASIHPNILTETKKIRRQSETLVRLTVRFMEDFAKAKEQKGIVDFNDFEHFALKILYQDGNYSDVANNYKERYYEVLVDEYQDTNDVQEAILKAVSRELTPSSNLFMVGDLKQSIYRFRLAKPEIFSKKYDAYTYEPSDHIKIDLAKNFRSRREVLDLCNHICEKVMSKEIGDVTYDEHAKLYYGAMGYDERLSFLPEITFLESSTGERSKTELQGMYIAKKIKEMLADESFLIKDKNGSLRRVRLGDICVLMRSPAGVLDELRAVFDAERISYFTDISSGYFDAVEVQIVLHFLRLLDNPYQDISMAAILRSPMIGIYENELMEIRSFSTEGMLYECAVACFEALDNQSQLHNKLKNFFELYNEFKDLSRRVPLSQLIRSFYSRTGYPYMVSFMENGNQRFVNLEFLEIHARKFEQSSYKGLFNFIRYIEHIQKYEVEILEPLVADQREDQVRFMSIHKSKGLEFSVVFIMDCQRQFNRMDLRKNFVLHQELGFGLDYIDETLHIKKDSLFSKAVKSVAQRELVSEELRLFYVALTRAKEKIFLVAAVKDYEEHEGKEQDGFARYMNKVPYTFVSKANSLLDFVVMSCPKESSLYHFNYLTESELAVDEAFEVLVNEERSNRLKDILETEIEVDPNSADILFRTYHHEAATQKFSTMSVSELKDSDHAYLDTEYAVTYHYEPEFINDEDAKQHGTRFGTLMHKILMHLPITDGISEEEIHLFIESLYKQHVINEEEYAMVDRQKIIAFTQSALYMRMTSAANENRLFREQPFVLGIPEEDDLRMIQGVIDVFFIEDGQGVLIDYKTDVIKEHQSDLLLRKYDKQLRYYKEAIEKIMDIKVKESYIFSLFLGKSLLQKE